VQEPDERINPRALWPPRSSPDSIDLSNRYAQQFRVTPAPVPVPISLPGTEYWYVEALNDYSKEWPSIRITQGHVQLRAGFLNFVDDPKSVPFFFYKGLEQVRYTWGDRAFQLLYTAVYAGTFITMGCTLKLCALSAMQVLTLLQAWIALCSRMISKKQQIRNVLQYIVHCATVGSSDLHMCA
jgi:hypothetical protein